MGILVWQDMPNGGAHVRWPLDGAEIKRSEEESAQFEQEWTAIIRLLQNHPSIVAWVPFNEAWGQFRTLHWTERTRPPPSLSRSNERLAWVCSLASMDSASERAAV